MRSAEAELDDIKTELLAYGRRLADENSRNLTDASVQAEVFYEGLLNQLFHLELYNCNRENSFTAGIDLIDPEMGIAYQITSRQYSKSGWANKVSEAQRGLAEHMATDRRYANVKHLHVLFIAERQLPPSPSINPALAAQGVAVHAESLHHIFAEIDRRKRQMPQLVDGEIDGFPERGHGWKIKDTLDYMKGWLFPSATALVGESYYAERKVAQDFQNTFGSLTEQIAAGGFSPRRPEIGELLAQHRFFQQWYLSCDYYDALKASITQWMQRSTIGITRVSHLPAVEQLERRILTAMKAIRDAILFQQLRNDHCAGVITRHPQHYAGPCAYRFWLDSADQPLPFHNPERDYLQEQAYRQKMKANNNSPERLIAICQKIDNNVERVSILLMQHREILQQLRNSDPPSLMGF